MSYQIKTVEGKHVLNKIARFNIWLEMCDGKIKNEFGIPNFRILMDVVLIWGEVIFSFKYTELIVVCDM